MFLPGQIFGPLSKSLQNLTQFSSFEAYCNFDFSGRHAVKPKIAKNKCLDIIQNIYLPNCHFDLLVSTELNNSKFLINVYITLRGTKWMITKSRQNLTLTRSKRGQGLAPLCLKICTQPWCFQYQRVHIYTRAHL